jgi:hypothetical protein
MSKPVGPGTGARRITSEKGHLMNNEDLFGPVIHTYTRERALKDGYLVAVDRVTAIEAGFGVPVALTAAAYADCVAWDEADTRQTGELQGESGRLWDVLMMMRFAIARSTGNPRLLPFEVNRIPRETGGTPRPVSLVVAAGPGDDGELVLTVLLKGED